MRLKYQDIAKLIKGWELDIELEVNYYGNDDWEVSDLRLYEDAKGKRLTREELGDLLVEILSESLMESDELFEELKTEYNNNNRY